MASDAGHHCDLVVIGLSNLTAKEFKYANHFFFEKDRKPETAAKSFFSCNRKPWKVVITTKIRYPVRLSGRQYAAWQSNAKREHKIASKCLKFCRLKIMRVPHVHATQYSGLRVNIPDSANLPTGANANGLKYSRSGFGR